MQFFETMIHKTHQKAPVLPEPVLALAKIFFPFKAIGIAAS